MRLRIAGFFLSMLAGNLAGQGNQPKPHFEVATVKAYAPESREEGGKGSSGGPGTTDPGRFTATHLNLSDLLVQAFNIRRYQIRGPGFLDSLSYNVNAKVPHGTTREQFRLMLQSLLEERFQMAIHWEKKESQVFELIQAKAGHKLKESVEDSVPPAESASTKGETTARASKLEPGIMAMRTGADGATKIESHGVALDQIVRMLSNWIGKPVLDATGLKGKYDFNLSFSMEGLPGLAGFGPQFRSSDRGGPAPSGTDVAPSIFTAVQEQLGLKLEQKKRMIEILVVDKVEKTPIAN